MLANMSYVVQNLLKKVYAVFYLKIEKVQNILFDFVGLCFIKANDFGFKCDLRLVEDQRAARIEKRHPFRGNIIDQLSLIG